MWRPFHYWRKIGWDRIGEEAGKNPSSVSPELWRLKALGGGEVNKILAEQRRIRARACSAVKNGFIIRLENNYHPGRASRADFCGSGRCLHFDEMSGDRERERLQRQNDAGNWPLGPAFAAGVGLLLGA